MQDAIQKLASMGQMPSDHEEISSETLEAYESLLKEIKTPIGADDAQQLVLLFPEGGLFGLEWTLLHIFETAIQMNASVYEKIIERCPSDEWRDTLLRRFENYTKQQS